jgi:hypothetical protein
LRIVDTANDNAQFTILFSLLQKFRYEDKKGFSRLLALYAYCPFYTIIQARQQFL